ncbi:putative cytochrome c oxidase subunit VII [Helianthus annuus]|nr:putative cytochrome c oxidase subunit VII [Helianthus annuus]
MVDEAPFRAREKLIEKQRLFQSIQKHTHLKGPVDKITSVAIPLALAGSSLFLIVSLPIHFYEFNLGLRWQRLAGWVMG